MTPTRYRLLRAAAVRVELHVALVDELAIGPEQLDAVQLHVDLVGPLARLPTVPETQLDRDAVLGRARRDARVGQAEQRAAGRDRTVGVHLRDVIVHTVGLDVELAQDATARLVAAGVAADDHLLAVDRGDEPAEGDEVAHFGRRRRWRVDGVDVGDEGTVELVDAVGQAVSDRYRGTGRGAAADEGVDLYERGAHEAGRRLVDDHIRRDAISTVVLGDDDALARSDGDRGEDTARG